MLLSVWLSVLTDCGFVCFFGVCGAVGEGVFEEAYGVLGGGFVEGDDGECFHVHAAHYADDGVYGCGLSGVFGDDHAWFFLWVFSLGCVFFGYGFSDYGGAGDRLWVSDAGVENVGWVFVVRCRLVGDVGVLDGAVEDAARGGCLCASAYGFAYVFGHALEEPHVVGLVLDHVEHAVHGFPGGVGVSEEILIPVDWVEDVLPVDVGGVPWLHGLHDVGVGGVAVDGGRRIGGR